MTSPNSSLVPAHARRYLSAMRMWQTRLVYLAVLLPLVLGLRGDWASAQIRLQTFERDQVTIVTADGGHHRFDVELALNGAQHAQGLMFRRGLAEQAGMLFIYRREDPVSMWMKNTFIPLDMLFIRRDGRVVKIVERTVPQSMEIISSGQPVIGVLELNGGTAARLGLQPGDRVLHRAFEGGS